MANDFLKIFSDGWEKFKSAESTLVRKFAADHQHDLFEINLEKHPELNDVFAMFDVLSIIGGFEGFGE
mgnify:CR=1 FL=1